MRLAGTPRRVETGQDGSFSFQEVEPGRYSIWVALVGYRPVRDSVTVSEGDSGTTLRVSLEPVAFALSEIVVRAAPPGPESHAQIISKEQLRSIAATAEDLFRAVQTLPGIASQDWTASFLVRGGESDETLVRLDEVDLLEPYHVRDWGGALSVVSLDAVGSARLQRGGLPARYGRQLSGVFEIRSPVSPPSTRFQMGAGLSQVRGILAGPLASGGSYLLGARHGLLAALYRSYPLDPDIDVEPDFQDLLAEIRLRPAERQEITLLALGSHDHLHYSENFDEADVDGHQRNVTLGGLWTARPSDRLRHRTILSGDLFDRRRTVGRAGRDDDLTRAVRGRIEGEMSLSANHSLEAGVGAEWEDARIHFDEIDARLSAGNYIEEVVTAIRGPATRRRVEGFASLHSRWGARLSTTAGVNLSRDAYAWGLRRDGFVPRSSPGGGFASPRLSVAARIGGGVVLRGAAGVLRQPTFLNNLNSERTFLPLGRRREAREGVLGLDLRGAAGSARVEGYVRRDLGIGYPIQDQSVKPALQIPLDAGRSRGVEIYLQPSPWGPFDAWMGYAWSKATWETTEGVVPRSFDQRHALTLSANLRPAGRWSVNATGRYHTGTPYTRHEWVSPDGRYDWSRQFGPFMGARYPDYFRLDFRLAHPVDWGLPGGRVYLELINVTDHENVHVYSSNFEELPGGGSSPVRTSIELLPRIPSAGVELWF